MDHAGQRRRLRGLADDGALTLDGETPGTVRTALRLFDMDEPADLSTADGRVQGTVTLARALGNPTATVDLTSSLRWPDQPVIDTRAQAVITVDAGEPHLVRGLSAPAARLDAHDRPESRHDRRPVRWHRGAGRVVAAALRSLGAGHRSGGRHGQAIGPVVEIVVDADVAGGPLVVAGQAFDRVTRP